MIRFPAVYRARRIKPHAGQNRDPPVNTSPTGPVPVARGFGIFQAVGFFRMERCPTQAVLPLVGLAA
ncbi:MAG: hypothetical protein ACQESR_28250 [Planctomycetota bacterium]